MKTIITSDSTCDLSRELLSRYSIDIIPLYVSLGEKTYRDRIDMDVQDIFRYVAETGQLPKTAAVNIASYVDFFRKYTEAGCSVIHFSLGSEFSSCCQNACLAAAELGNVTVIDSRNLSTGQGLLVLRAAELAEAGMPAEEIAEECRALTEKVDMSFVISSLEHLSKGGRCSALAAFGANLLNLKPCIIVKDGIMVPEKKYRGSFEHTLLPYFQDRLRNPEAIDCSRVILVTSLCSPEIIEKVRNEILRLVPDIRELPVTTAGSTITTHCGGPAIGISFIRK